MGDNNEKVGGCISAFLFVFFLILAIAIPISLINETEDEMCAQGTELKQGEQMVCYTSSYSDKEWKAEYDYTKGSKYIHVYRTLKSNPRTTTRVHEYKDFTQELTSRKISTLYHTISSSLGVSGKINLDCSGENCDRVKIFVLTKKQWDAALDSSGKFRDDYATPLQYLTGQGSDLISFIKTSSSSYSSYGSGSEMYYLAFTMKMTDPVKLLINMEFEYTVYDFSDTTEKTCLLGSCEFEDFQTGEMIAIEYEQQSPITSSDDTDYPFSLSAQIHNYDIDWSSVIGTAIVCAFFAFVFFCCSIVFIVKAVKKVGKVGKKVGKVVAKAAESSTTSSTTVVVAADPVVQPAPVAVAAVPTAPVAAAGAPPSAYDPNMAAGYPAPQPYPAQPYPAQAGYPPDAQPYPAQPYPGQPYPGAEAGYPPAAQAGYPPEEQRYPDGQPPVTVAETLPEPERGSADPSMDNEQRF